MKLKLKVMLLPLAFLMGTVIMASTFHEQVWAAVTKNWQVQDRFSLFNAGVSGTDVGVTQGLLGGVNTMELTSADSKGFQSTRMLLRGATDYADTEFYSGPRGGEILRMLIKGTNGSIIWGKSGTLANDQGGSIELGGLGTPYLDFKNDPNSDFDARLVLASDDALSFVGTNVGIDNYNPTAKLDVNGEIATRNSSPINSNNNNLAGVGIGWIGDQARIRTGGDGPGGKNGLAIQEVGDTTLLKIDEVGGVLNLTSDYSTICIGKC